MNGASFFPILLVKIRFSINFQDPLQYIYNVVYYKSFPRFSTYTDMKCFLTVNPKIHENKCHLFTWLLMPCILLRL